MLRPYVADCRKELMASIGSLTAALVHALEVFKLILIHNHRSGDSSVRKIARGSEPR